MELLVVVGIISLLISILLPALSRARTSAVLVQCSSNLRQIGLGIAMYAGDNHLKMLRQSDQTNRWPTALMAARDLPQASSRVFLCPAQDQNPTNAAQQFWELGGGYGLNSDLNAYGVGQNDLTSFGGNKITQVARAADYVLAWDSATPLITSASVGWVFDGSNFDGPSPSATREPDPIRHRARGNVLFLDGHVTTVANKQIQPGWLRFDGINIHR